MITIITKDYCPYCDAAKNLLSSLGLDYEEIDVTNDDLKWKEIVSISQMMTVPQIFSWKISWQNLLWWYDDISKLNEEWKLLGILKK